MSSRHRFTPYVTASRRNSRTAIRCHSDKKTYFRHHRIDEIKICLYDYSLRTTNFAHRKQNAASIVKKKCEKCLRLSVIFCTFAAYYGKVFPDIFLIIRLLNLGNLVNVIPQTLNWFYINKIETQSTN